jgi:4-hydroxybenzoate polyprenyltransferase
VGYPTLPQKVGIKGSVSIASVFFVLTAVLAPLPYFFGFFGRYYVSLIIPWGVLLIYASTRLLFSAPTVANVKRYERLITMSMMLLILALIAEALAP